MVLVGNLQKSVNPLPETPGVLFPRKIVQKNAHGVEANGFGPAELKIDSLGIKRIRLPHLKLVDSGSGNIVAANQPELPGIPIVGSFFSPALQRLSLKTGVETENQYQSDPDPSGSLRHHFGYPLRSPQELDHERNRAFPLAFRHTEYCFPSAPVPRFPPRGTPRIRKYLGVDRLQPGNLQRHAHKIDPIPWHSQG